MDTAIHFRDNTYGVAGAAGDPHPTAIHEYGDWAGLKFQLETSMNGMRGLLGNYVRGLTWNAYISEFGTSDERNDGRAQETAALSLTSTWKVSLKWMIFAENR